MKKFLTMVLAIIIAASFSSCGEKNDVDSSDSVGVTESSHESQTDVIGEGENDAAANEYVIPSVDF